LGLCREDFMNANARRIHHGGTEGTEKKIQKKEMSPE